MNAKAAPGKQDVTIARADWILYHRRELRLLAGAIMPKTSTSVVALGVTGGADESKIETTAIERATITEVLDEADKAIRACWLERPDVRSRQAFRRAMELWYDQGKTWRQVGRAVHYVPQHCRRFRDEARRAVAERLGSLPGTAMEDFWAAVKRHIPRVEETRREDVFAKAHLAGEKAQKMSTKMSTFGAKSG